MGDLAEAAGASRPSVGTVVTVTDMFSERLEATDELSATAMIEEQARTVIIQADAP